MELASVNPHLPFALVGLGNVLMSDEGLGVRLVEALVRDGGDSLADVDLIDGGTVGLQLLPRLEGRRGVLFADAARLDAAAGTVRVLEGAAFDAFLAGRAPTAHDVGLHDLVTALRLSGGLPDRRGLVAVQPLTLAAWGDLSEPVAAALVGAAAQARGVLAAWRG